MRRRTEACPDCEAPMVDTVHGYWCLGCFPDEEEDSDEPN